MWPLSSELSNYPWGPIEPSTSWWLVYPRMKVHLWAFKSIGTRVYDDSIQTTKITVLQSSPSSHKVSKRRLSICTATTLRIPGSPKVPTETSVILSIGFMPHQPPIIIVCVKEKCSITFHKTSLLGYLIHPSNVKRSKKQLRPMPPGWLFLVEKNTFCDIPFHGLNPLWWWNSSYEQNKTIGGTAKSPFFNRWIKLSDG